MFPDDNDQDNFMDKLQGHPKTMTTSDMPDPLRLRQSDPRNQSVLSSRRVQRIVLFVVIFVCIVSTGLYHRSELTTSQLHVTTTPYHEPKKVSVSIAKGHAPAPSQPAVAVAKPNAASVKSGPHVVAKPPPATASQHDIHRPATPATRPVDTSPPALDHTRVAVIIETRPISHLPVLILAFINNLPPQWTLKHIGEQPAFDVVRAHSSLIRHIESGKLTLVELPSKYPTKSQEDISATLTDVTFYRDFLAPAEWLLMFQTDSMICSGSPLTVDDFVDMKYDWAGAPWHPKVSGGNGGLSLRHVPPIVAMLEKEKRKALAAWEDVWICARLKNAMPPAIERSFSVESIWHETPLGYHLRGSGKLVDAGIWGNQTRRRQIFEYCPEVKLIMPLGLESPEEEKTRIAKETEKVDEPEETVEETTPETAKESKQKQAEAAVHETAVKPTKHATEETSKNTANGLEAETASLEEEEQQQQEEEVEAESGSGTRHDSKLAALASRGDVCPEGGYSCQGY